MKDTVSDCQMTEGGKNIENVDRNAANAAFTRKDKTWPNETRQGPRSTRHVF